MARIKDRAQIYIRMDTHLLKKLDKRIARMGYSSRSEFFAAVTYAALGEAETEKGLSISQETDDWLKARVPALTEDEIRKKLLKIIGDTLTPVIAIRGIDIAFPATWKDTRRELHEQTGVWATESEIKEAYRAFDALNKTALAEYKNTLLTTEETK